MEKLLSVIIPTYNMEAYLNRTLDSLLVPENLLGKLEVVVVNDGSKDNSSAIAHEYAKKFPNTFIVIDKENGNYGSCINVALPKITGKYVRILDADDYYNTEEFTKFLRELENCDADAVFTDYSVISAHKKITKTRDFEKNKVVPVPEKLDHVAMHELSYKTEILRKINYFQTEGVSFTDSEWEVYPFPECKTMIYIPANIYQYNLAREGQTCTPIYYFSEKGYRSWKAVFDRLANALIRKEVANNLIRQTKIKDTAQTLYQYQVILGENTIEELEKLDALLKNNFPDIYEETAKACKSCGPVKLYYVKYWREHHKKHPWWKILFSVRNSVYSLTGF